MSRRQGEIHIHGHAIFKGYFMPLFQVITVFSAPNYCDKHTNKGAVCILHGDDVSMPEFRRFEAVSHPPVDSMKYASLLMRIGML